jgi:hypothetical protein
MANVVVVRFELNDTVNSKERFMEARHFVIGEHNKTIEEMGM